MIIGIFIGLVTGIMFVVGMSKNNKVAKNVIGTDTTYRSDNDIYYSDEFGD